MYPTNNRLKWIILFLLAVLLACNSDKGKPAALGQDEADSLFKKFQLDKVRLPDGFKISVYALVPDARSMCFGDKGTLFVGNRGGGNVYAVTNKNGDGYGDNVYVIAQKLIMPCGVAFRNGSLYVAERSRILRYDNIEDHLTDPPSPVVVYDKFPADPQHGWKFIAFGPDGKLYVPVGAPCNVCLPPDSVHETITRMNPDGSDMEIFAKGVRNSVGFAWHPQTHKLWFTDNGRDNLGDDIPNDELNYAPQKGMHFGFPYCHEGDIPDPQFGVGKSCADYIPPALKLGPHVAALGMRFYTGQMFPAAYNNRIFIAEHGSWNRSVPIGYRVMMVTLDGDKVVKYEPFAEGWLQAGSEVLGRPADVQVAPDGALLISDDLNGVIYRVTYSN